VRFFGLKIRVSLVQFLVPAPSNIKGLNQKWLRRRRDLPLYVCVQAWDRESARECAKAYAGAGFDGIAIGGLVPRARDTKLVQEIVETVREECNELPLHVFGLGKPEMVKSLYDLGVDSVDSSSYIKLAADGRLWSSPEEMRFPSTHCRLHLALCNLAYATQKTLPLSATELIFSTTVRSGK
jgi:tRNA-guanine family transglycosylase